MLAYRTARSPVSLGVSLPATSTQPASVLSLSADPGYGVTDAIPLPVSGNARPQPTTVTLQYSLTQANQPVWVQAYDGGTINGAPGGQLLALNAAGALNFTFQAPARGSRFQVGVRLSNVEHTLRFVITDAAATAAPAP